MPLVWAPCDKDKCYMGHAVKGRCGSLSQLQVLTVFSEHEHLEISIFSTVLSNSSKDFHFFSWSMGNCTLFWTQQRFVFQKFHYSKLTLIRANDFSNRNAIPIISNFLEIFLTGVSLFVRLQILCCFFSLPLIQWIHLVRSVCHVSLHKACQHIFLNCRYKLFVNISRKPLEALPTFMLKIKGSLISDCLYCITNLTYVPNQHDF